MSVQSLTQEALKEILSYDQSTGIFVWIKDAKTGTRKAGKIAGTFQNRSDGKSYRQIKIKSHPYRSHRLAWLYMKGYFPASGIDHIDGDGTNNVFSNLREATQLENQRNRRKSKNNKSGICGVSKCKQTGKWRSAIWVNRKYVHLGRYDDLKDAIKARKEAEIKYDFHPNHGQSRPL